MFHTTRMGLLRGVAPSFLPGEIVYLQREVQGFPKGAQAKIISVQTVRPGEHRYHLLLGEEKVWAYEADLRPTAPGEAPLAVGPAGQLSITQRLQSMTLSQRMATLGVDEKRRLSEMSNTQRMHALTQEERMRDLLKTNRAHALKPGQPAAATDGNGASGAPAEGAPLPSGDGDGPAR